MFKVIIKNLSNIETHSATFSTMELATEWIAQQRLFMSWGKVTGFYPISFLSINELASEISRQTVDIDNQPLYEPMIEIPDQFTVEIIDISIEFQKRQIEQEALKRQAIGQQILAVVFRINQMKNLTSEQFEAILADPILTKIERLLWSGSLSSAKALIQSIDTTFFTLDEKNEILNLLGDY